MSDLDVRASKPPELDPDQALVAFTSGSTGRSKGVVLSHGAFGSKLAAIAEVLPFGDGDVTLQVLQLNFTFGQWTTLLTLLRGGTVRLVQRFSSRDVLTELLARRVDRIAVVPTMLRLMLAALDDAGPGWDRLACARSSSPGLWIAGGEPLAAGLGRRVLETFPRTRIADVFGLSETSTSDLILTPDAFDDGAGTVGRPSPGVEVRIVGEDGADRAVGDAGELWIRTPFLMTGYLGDPVATSAAMSGQWFRTGDLACFRETGEVELVGRSKFLIVRGGHKISPLRVEGVIAEHPACRGTCAVGVPDPLLGERIVVLVVASRDNDVSPDEFRSWARMRMNPYEVPDRFVLVEGLPVGRTGKLDRLAAYDLLGKETVGSPE